MRLALDRYRCRMRRWRGDYLMRTATCAPFLVVSQLVVRGNYRDTLRLLLATLLGLLAAAAGWATITAWRRVRRYRPGEPGLCCRTSNPAHVELPTVAPSSASAAAEPTKVASVVVERPKRGWYLDAARWRSYWIEIDGERAGKVGLGERLVIPVATGRHVVQARIDWTGSPKVHVYLHSGGAVVLRAHSAGSPLDTSLLLGKDKWLALHVAIDSGA
jgi:hypothetical protein